MTLNFEEYYAIKCKEPSYDPPQHIRAATNTRIDILFNPIPVG